MNAQMSEVVFVDGAEHELMSLPLEPLLDTMDPRPELGEWADVWTTALRRGYVGHWEIAASRLYLKRLGTCQPEVDHDLERLFPGRAPPVFASWYSGKLIVPQGERLLYVHMGWGSWYQREIIFHVRHGHICKRRDVDHTLSRHGTSLAAPPVRRRGHCGSRAWHSEPGMADG